MALHDLERHMNRRDIIQVEEERKKERTTTTTTTIDPKEKTLTGQHISIT